MKPKIKTILLALALIIVTGCQSNQIKSPDNVDQPLSRDMEKISMKQCQENEIPLGDWMKVQITGGGEEESFTFQYCVDTPKKYKNCDKIFRFPYKTAATNVPEKCICVGDECPILKCSNDNDCKGKLPTCEIRYELTGEEAFCIDNQCQCNCGYRDSKEIFINTGCD